MKTIKIHDFPMPDDAKLICDMQNEFYGYPLGERYYLAYETDPNPERPISCLWTDLKWLSKFYGVTHFDENCDITDESLNAGRDATIAKNKDMIERNIHWWDYDDVKENGMVDIVDGRGNKTSRTIEKLEGSIYIKRTITEREPRGLTKSQIEHLTSENNKGRFIICRYIR